MIYLTGKEEPMQQHADRDGFVRAYNVIRGVWENRYWYDFPSHPNWTEDQREGIFANWPKWACNKAEFDGCPLVVIVISTGLRTKMYKTRTFPNKESATLEELQSIGVPFRESNGDLLHLEVVSSLLWSQLSAEWIRP